MSHYNAAQQARVMGFAKEALTKLTVDPAALLPRAQLFYVKQSNGPIEKMQGRALLFLERTGAIASVRSSEKGGRGVPRLWGVNNHELALQLLTDDVKLASALWPSKKAVAPLDEGPELTMAPDVAEPEVIEALSEESAVADPAPSAIAELQEAMLAVLKVTSMMGESLAVINAKLGAIERQTNGITLGNELLQQIAIAQSNVLMRLNEIPEAVFTKEPARVVSALLGALSLPRLGEAEARKLAPGDELLYYNGPLPEPVRVMSVRTTPGQPVTVTVGRQHGDPVPVTPKFLSRRSAA